MLRLEMDSMPALLLFAPCERVAFDQAEQSASLINVFQGFNVTLMERAPNETSEIPKGAVVVEGKALPMRWAIFALWRKTAEDDGKDYVQICDLISPSGKRPVHASLQFSITHSFQRNIMNVVRFPIDEQGNYLLKLYLAEKDKEPTLVTTYPISVAHIPEDHS